MLRIAPYGRIAPAGSVFFFFCYFRSRGSFGELKHARAAVPKESLPWCYES